MLTSAFNSKAEDQKIKDHNYAVGGHLDNAGRILTNASQEHNDPTAPQNKDKKKAEELRRMLHIQEAQRQLDDMINDMQDIIDDMNALARRIKKGQDLLADGDIDAITVHLAQEYGYAPDDLENMSDAEKTQALENEIGEDKLDFDGLKNKLETIAKQYEQDTKSGPLSDADKAKYLQKLDDIKEKSSHLDYNQAEKEVIFDNENKLGLLRDARGDERSAQIDLKSEFTAKANPPPKNSFDADDELSFEEDSINFDTDEIELSSPAIGGPGL